MTVYGYIRVSTDKQTTENQRFEIERYLENKNLAIDVWINETIRQIDKNNIVWNNALLDSLCLKS